MSCELSYDVLLSHSAKDKAGVREVAERLRKDGVKVWFDGWEILKAEGKRMKDETEPHPLEEEGLERSRVLVLCMSANAFGSDWAQLESGKFQMQGHHALRDPLNKECRFLPLRLEGKAIGGQVESPYDRSRSIPPYACPPAKVTSTNSCVPSSLSRRRMNPAARFSIRTLSLTPNECDGSLAPIPKIN